MDSAGAVEVISTRVVTVVAPEEIVVVASKEVTVVSGATIEDVSGRLVTAVVIGRHGPASAPSMVTATAATGRIEKRTILE